MSLPTRTDQIHSFHQPILPNGLYWTTFIPDSALRISPDGRDARLEIRDYPVIDQPKFPQTEPTYQATVSLTATWHGSGSLIGYTDPAAKYRITFYPADARIEFTASVPSIGFSFTSDPLAGSESVFAIIGTDRNGSYF